MSTIKIYQSMSDNKVIEQNTLENVIIKNEKLLLKEPKFFIARIIYNDRKFHISYDFEKDNLIIHEWYYLDKSQLSELTETLKSYFKNKAAA